MKNKKILLAGIMVAVLVVAGGLCGWKYYSTRNHVVTVVPVELLNSDWAVDQEGSSGTVKSSLSQSVVPDSDKEIDKIYVEEGQQVKIGDKILSYTMEIEQLELELKGYDLQEQEYAIKRAEKELANLKKGIVSDISDSYGSVGNKTVLLASISMRSQNKEDDVETLKNTKVSANQQTEEGIAVQTENSTGTTTESSSEEATATEDKSEVPVKDTENTSKTTASSKTTESTEDSWVDDTPSYTQAEINEMITAKENEITDLKIQLKEDQLEYDRMKKEVDDGTITAAVTGIVKEVNDPEEAAAEGNPVVVIVSAKEMYVQGIVDEFAYHTLQKGTTLTATSWDTGNIFQAKITEISSYPVKNASYYGVYSSNPNISYYPYTAVIEGDTDSIENGESVSITLRQGEISEDSSLYIPLPYVRTEGNQSYVYIRGENGRLKKKVVETGQTLYNSVIEVKSGLTLDDSIAFPYGTTVKEGARTEISEDGEDVVY